MMQSTVEKKPFEQCSTQELADVASGAAPLITGDGESEAISRAIAARLVQERSQ